MKNPFRKITVETIEIMPNFKLYHGTNFIETHVYETRWIQEHGAELFMQWGLKLNPIVWLLLGCIILYFKIKGKNWREELSQ